MLRNPGQRWSALVCACQPWSVLGSLWVSVPEVMRCPGGVLWEQTPLPAVSPTTASSAPSRPFRPPALAVAAPGVGGAGRGRGKMAAGGAADAQARFGHSVKGLLTEKVTSCGTDVIALTKQVLKGSRSAEVSGGCWRAACYRAGAERGAGSGAGGTMHAGSCSRRREHILVSGQGRGQRDRDAGTAGQRLGTPAVAGGRVTASSAG